MEDPARRKIMLKKAYLSIKRRRQGVLTKRQYVTCWEWERVGFIHYIAFSIKKVVSSESGEKYAQIKHHLQEKTVQNSSKKICI